MVSNKMVVTIYSLKIRKRGRHNFKIRDPASESHKETGQIQGKAGILNKAADGLRMLGA